MIRLLRLLREQPQAVEADLQRWYQVDYRDRWHPEPRSRLTLRRLAVLIRHLPADSVVARAETNTQITWDLEHHLLDDIRQAVTALSVKPKPHPQRPKPQPHRRHVTTDRRRKLADARRRAAARQRAIDAGEIT